MRADGSHVRRLTRNPFSTGDDCGCDTDPNFSPGGRTITFVRVKRDDELAALFAIRVDGTHLRGLTPCGWNSDRSAYVGSYSPDGTSVAFRLEHDGVFDLATLPSAGGPITVVRRFTASKAAVHRLGPG